MLYNSWFIISHISRQIWLYNDYKIHAAKTPSAVKQIYGVALQASKWRPIPPKRKTEEAVFPINWLFYFLEMYSGETRKHRFCVRTNF